MYLNFTILRKSCFKQKTVIYLFLIFFPLVEVLLESPTIGCNVKPKTLMLYLGLKQLSQMSSIRRKEDTTWDFY